MDEDKCFLITILYNGELLQCALKIEPLRLIGDCNEFPMKPENRKQLHDLLPLHVKNCGEILEVHEIFEVCDLTYERKKIDVQEAARLINFIEKGLHPKTDEAKWRKRNQDLLIELEERRRADAELAETTSFEERSNAELAKTTSPNTQQIISLFFKHREIARELQAKYRKEGN